MPEYKDTIDDFNLKWSHTYAFLNNEVVYIDQAVIDEKEEQYFVMISKNQKTEHMVNFDFDLLTPISFDSQFFNACDLDVENKSKSIACLHIARSSKRQNKRSICRDNSVIVSPLRPLLKQINRRFVIDFQISEKYILQILKQSFPTYQKSLELCNNYLMVALSPDFAVALSSISKDKYLLASQFGFIGEADKECLYVHHQGSLQEVNDFVRRNNLNLRVVNATNT